MIGVRLRGRFVRQIVQIFRRNPIGFQEKSVLYDGKDVVQADAKAVDFAAAKSCGHCAVLPQYTTDKRKQEITGRGRVFML